MNERAAWKNERDVFSAVERSAVRLATIGQQVADNHGYDLRSSNDDHHVIPLKLCSAVNSCCQQGAGHQNKQEH